MPIHFNKNEQNRFQDWPAEPDMATEEADDALWELFSVYVDGEATPEEAAQVEAMLLSSPAYARDFAFLKQASESARTYVEVEPPASLRDSIFAATTRRPTLARRALAAWTDFQGSLRPNFTRYGLPAGALAAGLAAFALWPRPANTPVVRPAPQPDKEIAKVLPPKDNELPAPPAPAINPDKAKENTTNRVEKPTRSTEHESNSVAPNVKIAAAKETGKTAATSAALVRPPHREEKPKAKDKPNRIQSPTPIDSGSLGTVVATNYSIKPNMDDINQRQSNMTLASMKETIHGLDVQNDASEGTNDNGAHLTSAAQTDEIKGTVVTTVQSNVRIRRARLNLAQLPDPRRILTSAEMRRHDNALPNADFQPLQRTQHEEGTALLTGRF